MTPDLELERRLRAALREGPEACPPGVVDGALRAIARHPARRGRWSVAFERLADRLGPPLTGLRLAAVLVALLVLLAALLAAAGGLVRPSAPMPRGMNGLLAVVLEGDVWLVDVHAGTGQRLPTPEVESAVAWSPDGRWLATRVATDSGLRVELAGVDGKGRRTLLGPTGWLDGTLAWSPDASTLAVAAGPTAADARVLVVAVDGGGARTLDVPAARAPAYSPDGGRLAFLAVNQGSTVVHVADAGGTSRRLFAAAPGEGEVVGGPAWTPDGRSLFIGLAGASAPARVVLLDARLGTVVDEASVAGPPRWLVAFDGGATIATGAGLETVALGAGPAPAARRATLPGIDRTAGLAMSPDGRRVAALGVAACGRAACPARIIVMSAGGLVADARVAWVATATLDDADPTNPAAAWQPLPRPAGPVTFRVDETCSTASEGTRVPGPGAGRWEGIILRCTDRASDPRLSGTRTAVLDSEARPDGTIVLAGTAILENDDGSWHGPFAGTIDAGGWHRLEASPIGSGAFAGLALDIVVTGNGIEFTITGGLRPRE